MLKAEGRKCSRGFHFKDWIVKQPNAQKLSFPAVKGKERMNPSTFCQNYTEGVYICKVAKHVFTVIDGVVYDDFENRPNRCIYNAWKIN